ncbi:hypothetical protein F0P96_16070 [Hymenobacter busanensis]|uniref:Uncharacterized protein n=1 Tax=Hymenobacter busanensis TaxID=2607656 RepID=A0A7L4ZTL6_9BACT|nr:hypothetical protein [Hymenobacter busanensis]KAA9327497.1 hypothetical protein F0P96_16070 [Hymenobacter busanensis]QHJ06165.1 hypothetical protein GUY19_02165 [Hymenobacter busanensis]
MAYLCGVKMFCRFAALVLLLPLLPGCLSLESDEEKEAAAEKKLMARHDELMARMDELYTLRQQLGRVPDTLAAGRQRRALLRADAAMMDWMHQYRKPADSVDHARTLAYFGQQQHRIDSVGVLMQHSIDSARVLLPAASH